MRKIRYAFRAIWISGVLVFWAASFEPAQAETPPGRFVEVVIPAPSLEGNLLGDPTEQPVSIYLPPAYEASVGKRYPVIYLLHGFTGTNRTWMIAPDSDADEPSPSAHYARAGKLSSERLDAAIAAGSIREMIIVAPNGRNAFQHSFYVNSPVTGNWEDYIVYDVVGYVDKNYRTLTNAISRGIAGHSGGGNGALFLAMRHADVFGSVYAMSPCCLGPMFSLPLSEQLEEGGELGEAWQEVFTRVSELTSIDQLPPPFTDKAVDFWLNAEVASGAAYLPNPDRPPLYADFLFEMEDGVLVRNDKAFERRAALSNFYLVNSHEDDLRLLEGIFIDYGENEMPSLVSGSSQFAQALALRGIPFTFEVYKGGDHGNLIADRFQTEGLAFFAETLDFAAE